MLSVVVCRNVINSFSREIKNLDLHFDGRRRRGPLKLSRVCFANTVFSFMGIMMMTGVSHFGSSGSKWLECLGFLIYFNVTQLSCLGQAYCLSSQASELLFFIFSGIPCFPIFGTPRQILPITLIGYLTGRTKYGQVRYPRKDHPKCGLDAVTLRYYAGADLSHPSRRHHRSNSEVSEVSLWKISPTFLSILIVGLLQTKGVAGSQLLLFPTQTNSLADLRFTLFAFTFSLFISLFSLHLFEKSEGIFCDNDDDGKDP